MTRLHEIVAVQKSVKSRTYGEITALDKQGQKAEPYNGFNKIFRKKDDEGEDFPAEKKKVTLLAENLLQQVAQLSTELFDVEATKDWGNCEAVADIELDGVVLAADVPATFLLFLEKQIVDTRTLVGRMPTLDENEDWTADPNSGLYRTGVSTTHRTKKVQKPIVLFPATPEHPAQTQLITEDEIVGWWDTTKFSGALPAPKKTTVLNRLDKLLVAVKQARERANNTEVKKIAIGSKLFSYLLG